MTTFLYVFVPKKDDIYMHKELKKRKIVKENVYKISRNGNK